MKLSNILLASSLFYFRIPREKWAKRMKLLKTAGYNTIDVYFPWNYHETAPGIWDFSGNRDVYAFLELAKMHGLFVIARPGPYICSEWDGGGLPSWLAADGVSVRQDDEEFLKRIGTWYDHILPVLEPFQISRGGTVLCMQIENELDFFDCKSPVSYMEKLMSMAAGHGIDIPLFYCCGQNDLLRAGGLTPGLYTAFNVYSDSNSPGTEERALHLYSTVSDRNMPFLITETNREHSYLKRLLACGAKLLGPYNQTAGNTMEWYNGITNWGTRENPIALMAADYDFDSMIGSAGEVNDQFYESRLLSGLLNSFPTEFAEAVPMKAEGMVIQSSQPLNAVIPLLHTTRGDFLELSNLGRKDTIRLQYRDFELTLLMASLETRLLPVNVVLSDKKRITLLYSSYEIGFVEEKEDRTTTAMYGYGDFIAVLDMDGEIKTVNGGYQDESFNLIVGSPKEIAVMPIPGLPDMKGKLEEQAEERVISHLSIADAVLPAMKFEKTPVQPMEKIPQYRGIGCYRFSVEKGGEFLFQEAADIITICRDGEQTDVIYGRGDSIFRQLQPGIYQIYTEIWGHSNFDDIRCKSLRMNSLKGIGKIVRINGREDISDNWLFDLDEQPVGEWYFFRHSNYNTIMGIDSYSRAVSPVRGVYSKWITVPDNADSLYLHFSRADCIIHVYVNGHLEADVLKDDPVVDISRYAKNDRIEVCLRTERKFSTDRVGNVTLIAGNAQTDCEYGMLPVETFKMPLQAVQTTYPIKLRKGKNYVMTLPLERKDGKEMKLFFRGKDIKLTIVNNHRVISRLVLPNGSFPDVRGGSRDTAYISEEWLGAEEPVIWCQTIGNEPELEEVKVCYYSSVCDA